MIAEAMEWIRTAVNRGRCSIVEKDTARIVVMDCITGEIVEHDRPFPPWKSVVGTLDSLAAGVRRFCDSGSNPAIWIASSQVTVILDDTQESFRDCRIGMTLAQSDVFGQVGQLQKLSPKDLVWKLRYSLFETTQVPEQLKTVLSAVKFSSGREAEHGNTALDASVARTVREKVTGTAQLPEEVVFSFLPYPALANDLGRQVVDVRCVLQVDAAAETISILPLPEQLATASRIGMEMIRSAIVQRLPELEDSVFFGVPG